MTSQERGRWISYLLANTCSVLGALLAWGHGPAMLAAGIGVYFFMCVREWGRPY